MNAVRFSLALATLGLAAAASAQAVLPSGVRPVSGGSVFGASAFGGTFLNALEVGLTGGYAGGGSGQLFVDSHNLAGSFGARLSLGRSSREGGFGDSADLSGSDLNGPPGSVGQQNKSGLIRGTRASAFTFGLDATYDLGQPVPGVATSLYGGLRYGQFNSRLTASGGPVTDYASSAFGLGLGTQIGYLLTNNFSIIGDLGFDRYFGGGPITRRGGKRAVTFRPGEAGYDAVNRVVERPGLVFKALLGVKYSF